MIILKILLFVSALFGTYIIFNFDKKVPRLKLWKLLAGILLFIALAIMAIETISIPLLFLILAIMVILYTSIILIGTMGELPNLNDLYKY